MQLVDGFWATFTYAVSYFTFSFKDPSGLEQIPIFPSDDLHDESLGGPIFKPPGGRLTGPGSDFVCNYSQMVGWTSCTSRENRQCWLKNEKTKQEINIHTNYEDTDATPVGVTRYYELDIMDDWINADGLNFTEGKVFRNSSDHSGGIDANTSYIGPWIQGCWGDNITVIVNNKLKHNGTSVHWHGIRQWLTMHMDGVNGITQCPVAPGDSFNYTWRAMQYGSSWYHSHYSVQYADGAVGPITLHGPSSENYDEPKTPLLMTDWGHDSAFLAITAGLNNESTLLNGKGNITRFDNAQKALAPIPSPYTITFEPPPPSGQNQAKRYLLQLINTSFESTFVFAIDNHRFQVVGADFVPIHSYMTTSVLVGIGQRYHVIVEANPEPSGSQPLPKDGNYWIRTWRADCFGKTNASPGYEKTGILRYNSSSIALPTTSNWSDIPTACSDEPYESLVPILQWKVGSPANDPQDNLGENFTVQFKSGQESIYPLAKFSMGGENFNPLRIDYGDPTFLHLNYTREWDPALVMFPENYKETDWVYMVLKGLGGKVSAHPIHLHGHDFAILQQISNATFPANLSLKLDNPPRRDVILLPNDGYVVIAFKTDNPGAWLVHCHIAFHASFGLAVQIMERQQTAADIWPDLHHSHALQTAQKGCDNWNRWWGDCNNWWPGNGAGCGTGNLEFVPDSGI